MYMCALVRVMFVDLSLYVTICHVCTYTCDNMTCIDMYMCFRARIMCVNLYLYDAHFPRIPYRD